MSTEETRYKRKRRSGKGLKRFTGKEIGTKYARSQDCNNIPGQLTAAQAKVIENLQKRGCDFLAACTEDHWRKREPYYIDTRVNVPLGLRIEFNRVNPREE